MAAMKGEKVRLAFERLHYTVPVKGSTPKLLLQDIKGEVTSGHVLAILGPSGAGKTTLLNMLTLQQNGGTPTGFINVNGEPLTPALYDRTCAYVEQTDTLWASLTVREHLAPGGGVNSGSLLSGVVSSDSQVDIKSESTSNTSAESDLLDLLTPKDGANQQHGTASHLHPSSALNMQTRHRSVAAIQSESSKIIRPKSPKRTRNGELVQSQLTQQLDNNPFDMTELRRASDDITPKTRRLKIAKKSVQHLNTGDANSDSELSDSLQNNLARRHQAQHAETILRRRSSSGTLKFLQEGSFPEPLAGRQQFQPTIVSTLTEEQLENSLDLSCMKLRRSLSDGFMTGLNQSTLPFFYEGTQPKTGNSQSNFFENTSTSMFFRGSRGNSIAPMKMSITPRGSVDSFTSGLTGGADVFGKDIKMESEDLLLERNEKTVKSPTALLVHDCMNSPWSPDNEDSLLSQSFKEEESA